MVQPRVAAVIFLAWCLVAPSWADEDETELDPEQKETDAGPPPDYVFVKLGDKSVKGVKVPASDDSVEYLSFRGIRYAQAPVGPFRFKVRTTL